MGKSESRMQHLQIVKGDFGDVQYSNGPHGIYLHARKLNARFWREKYGRVDDWRTRGGKFYRQYFRERQKFAEKLAGHAFAMERAMLGSKIF